MRVSMQYTDSYTESLFSFVNNIPGPPMAHPRDRFQGGPRQVFNNYARKVGALKGQKPVWDDFGKALPRLAVNVQKPQFEGQTKGKLGNTEVRPRWRYRDGTALLYPEDLKTRNWRGASWTAVQAAKCEAARRHRTWPGKEPAGSGAPGGQA